MAVIIFDFDGVIINSEKIVYSLVKNEMKKFGIEFTEQDFLNMYNKNFYESLKRYKFLIFKIYLVIKDIRKAWYKYIDKVPFFKGIKTMLRELSKTNEIYIISSNFTHVMEKILKKNKLMIFKDILGVEEGLSKTKKIKKIKSQYKNKNIYYVADTTGDIKEAKKAGVKTIAVCWGYHSCKKDLPKSQPDYIVNTPQDLLKLFKKK